MIRTVKTTACVARKKHVCYDCEGSICPGDAYEIHTVADGRVLYSWLSCAACKPWCDAVRDAGWVRSGDDLGPGWLLKAIDGRAYHYDTQTYEVRP